MRSAPSRLWESGGVSPVTSDPATEPAAPGRTRATRWRQSGPQRGSGPTTPIAATIPSSRKIGNGDCDGTGDHLADGPGQAGRDDLGEVRPEAIGIHRRCQPALDRNQLVDDILRGEREQGLPERADLERQHRGRGNRHPEHPDRLDLVQADGRQSDSADDHGGLAGLLDETPQDRVGRPDQCLGRDDRARPDEQPRSEPVAGAVAVHEAEFREGPQIAVDRRERGVEDHAELVRPDLAAIGDREQDAQATPERGVLAGPPPAGGRGRWSRRARRGRLPARPVERRRRAARCPARAGRPPGTARGAGQPRWPGRSRARGGCRGARRPGRRPSARSQRSSLARATCSARRRAANGAMVVRSSIPSAWDVETTSNETGWARRRASTARLWAARLRYVKPASAVAGAGTRPVGRPDHGVPRSLTIRSEAVEQGRGKDDPEIIERRRQRQDLEVRDRDDPAVDLADDRVAL